MFDLILASASEIRATLLRNAGLNIDVQSARVDENTIKTSLLSEGTHPRDIADALAQAKAEKIGSKNLDKIVLGCDQVLEFEGDLVSKPSDRHEAKAQLHMMSGKTHTLWSAAVVCEDGRPVWRHVSRVDLSMRSISRPYLQSYVDRNWESIRHSVGSYKLEEEGVRLFTQIRGDYFSVLGLPLLELLSWLTLRGTLES